MQLSIIIVNYNVKYFLEQCLLSVIKAKKNIDAEIIVIDNNSTDNSRAFLENFEEVKFTWNETNCAVFVVDTLLSVTPVASLGPLLVTTIE